MQGQRRDKGQDKPVTDPHREYLDEEFSDEEPTEEKSEIYGKSSKIASSPSRLPGLARLRTPVHTLSPRWALHR